MNIIIINFLEIKIKYQYNINKFFTIEKKFLKDTIKTIKIKKIKKSKKERRIKIKRRKRKITNNVL